MLLAVSSVGSLVKGKERSRVRRMRGASRRKEERRKVRKEGKKENYEILRQKRITKEDYEFLDA